MIRNIALLFTAIISLQLNAQVLPKEGSKLHYRIIGFSFPPVKGVSSYQIEIAAGAYSTGSLFTNKVVKSVTSKSNRVVIEVPEFGKDYSWRVVYDGVAKEVPIHHFSTASNQHIDTGMYRLRILQNAEQYKNMYVGVDRCGVLYDMQGRAVWYVPDTNGIGGNVADMKFTKEGTITFLYGDAYEINYNGDILWKSPVKGGLNDTAHGELYHHEFVKLPNGHLMALCMEVVLCKTITTKDSSYIVTRNGKEEADGYKLGKYGCLIEYDEHGKNVWMWKSSKYLMNADFAYFNPSDSNLKYDAHDNAFFYDEANSAIYLGYKNINRIIKIDYPSGKVSRTYGKVFKRGMTSAAGGDGFFCNQHSLGRTHDGYLLCFNNRACYANATPSVLMMQEPEQAGDTVKKVWEYSTIAEGNFTRNFYQGGNAIELPDGSVFVNMGSKYSKLFIVNREKKVLWSALPERYIESDMRWLPNYEYRTAIISREDLERMIWTAEGK